MVTSNNLVKIGDFGLAEDVYTGDYFRLKEDCEVETSLHLSVLLSLSFLFLIRFSYDVQLLVKRIVKMFA